MRHNQFSSVSAPAAKKPLFVPFACFRSALHSEWRIGRSLRSQAKANRRCLALMAFIDASQHDLLEESVVAGHRTLIPNRFVRWGAMQDVDAQDFAQSGKNRADVVYTTTIRATLSFGLPLLDFSGDAAARAAVDFAQMPYGRAICGVTVSGRMVVGGDDVVPCEGTIALRDVTLADPLKVERIDEAGSRTHGVTTPLHSVKQRREFHVFNVANRRMTDYATFTVDETGKDLNPSYAALRRPGDSTGPACNPASWMPVAYVGIRAELAEQLFMQATQTRSKGFAYPCGCCKQKIASVFFKTPRAHRRDLDDGDFIALCPVCKRDRKWHVDDAVPSNVTRQFIPAIKAGFIEAVRHGLPLRVSRACFYLGVVRGGTADKGPDLVCHEFEGDSGERFRHWLPTGAKVTAPLYDAKLAEADEAAAQRMALNPGDTWAYALPHVDKAWGRRATAACWADLAQVCGSGDLIGVCQALWFHSTSLIRFETGRRLAYYPAELVALAAYDVRPEDLFWDFGPCARFLIPGQSAFSFPPIPLPARERVLEVTAVTIDARIGDQRLRPDAYAFPPVTVPAVAVPPVVLPAKPCAVVA